MKYIIIIFILGTIVSCDRDGDRGSGRYTLCEDQILPQDERVNLSIIEATNWPVNVEEYIQTNFESFDIISVSTYEDSNNNSFINTLMDNDGEILFDRFGEFICADISFRVK